MPSATPTIVRKQLHGGKADPVYLIVGDDEAEMSQLANGIAALVEDELRAFNLERVYASDKSVTPSAIVQAARTLPMLGDRRVVLVLRAEKILKPKRRGKAVEVDEVAGGADPACARTRWRAGCASAAGSPATTSIPSPTRPSLPVVTSWSSASPTTRTSPTSWWSARREDRSGG